MDKMDQHCSKTVHFSRHLEINLLVLIEDSSGQLRAAKLAAAAALRSTDDRCEIMQECGE